MKPTNTHPWQSGPIELFKFALENLKNPNEINQRISFLLFDIGVETLFKTYLILPEEVTRTPLPYAERKKYANGNFHDLLKGIKLAANTKINETDLHHVKFYHNIRNNLYHQGNGITVRQDYVNGYATTATTLLKQLLEIDLTNLIAIETSMNQENSLTKETLINIRKELVEGISRLRDLVRLFTEKIEPKLIYPSTVGKLNEIATGINVSTFPSKLEEFRTLIEKNLNDPEMKSWLLHFISEDICCDGPQVILNTQFIMELGKDPISFYLFLIGFFYLPIDDVTKDSVEKSEDISFIDSDDYHVVGIYNVASSLVEFSLSDQNFDRLNMGVIERSQEVLLKLRDIVNRMEGMLDA
ncbi:MAG: hypothetical protein KAV45_02470 [Calditrichia bacterium]|nr:hypothetical protein [Calditrichia bacterium]